MCDRERQAVCPAFGEEGIIGYLLFRAFAYAGGKVAPKSRGQGNKRKIQRAEQQGLYAVPVLVGADHSEQLGRQAVGDEGHPAEGDAAEFAVVSDYDGSVIEGAGAAAETREHERKAA